MVAVLPRLGDRRLKDMNVTTELIDRIINRHTARLLTNLEQANCPEVYKQAVKAELNWIRSDLRELIEEEG
jgi:hypothetical protein